MINFEIEDLKVIGANALCMIVLQVNSLNIELQTILFLVTIIYTIIRIVNEIKKLITNGKTNVEHSDANKETQD
jgi:hypothetical protein